MSVDSHLKARRALMRVVLVGGGGAASRRALMGRWAFRIFLSVFIWTVIIQLASMTAVWQPKLLKSWPSPCLDRNGGVNSTNNVVADENSLGGALTSPRLLRFPQRVYRSNGYLTLSCNGGLNQMRAAICDMITIAQYLNLTFVIPQLDNRSFWADNSKFGDIFDEDHFIYSLRDEVKIVRKLPAHVVSKIEDGMVRVHSMQPVSWSNTTYYSKQILGLVRKHKVVHFEKTDNRLGNNNIPLELQKLRCRVNYEALRFAPHIEALGRKLISTLRLNNYFVVLHLRYEMDMLSFSGCSHGCSQEEDEELRDKREHIPWWKEKDIDSERRRLEGRCPLTPEETALVLQALGFDMDTTIYIAAGTIYGGERRMASLRMAYPNSVDKEMLLSSSELEPLRNHSNQMAALDYMIALASDVFIPTYDGNMAKVVEGHRRYNGFRKSIILDRGALVERLDLYEKGKISWEQFSSTIQKSHKDRWGQPADRKVIPGQPKVEDYFYANPQECLASPRGQHTVEEKQYQL